MLLKTLVRLFFRPYTGNRVGKLSMLNSYSLISHPTRFPNSIVRYYSTNQPNAAHTKMAFLNRLSSNFIKKSYYKNLLKHIVKELPESETAAIQKKIDELADVIFEKNSAMIADESSKLHLKGTSMILASYKVLLSKLEDKDKTINIIEVAFGSMGNSFKVITKLMLDFSRDPLKLMEDTSLNKMKETYGETFKFEHEGDGKTYFNIRIKECFYHNFFKTNNAPELTRVFCNWDKNWASAIDPKKHGIEFGRPTTLGSGGSECPFKFKALKVPTT